MDIVTDDQELARDLIKLLHAKLRQARQELQDARQIPRSEVALIDSSELKQRNEELREELLSLRFRLSAAADNEDNKETSFTAATVGTGSGLEEQAVEDLAKQQLGSQIKAQREQYRMMRDETDGLREILSAKLEDLERETSKMDYYKREVVIAESDMNELGFPEIVIPSLDVLTFLPNAQQMLDLPSISSLKAFLKSAPFRGLPQHIREQFRALKILVLPWAKEVIWSEDGVSRMLYVAPPYHYDPTADEGSRWVENPAMDDFRKVGNSQDLEVIVSQGHGSWYYYGTYRCVGRASLSGEASTTLKRTVTGNAIRTTTINKDYLAPLALKFIDTLYDNGPLSLQCLGFQRTGFHHELNDALLSSEKAIQSISSGTKTSTVEKTTTASLLTLQHPDRPATGKQEAARGRFQSSHKKSKKRN
ncbi:hypothetical protein C8Q79DRAFT_934762 [Trametes meyenii]|nr:hypothetical protein C8Q79DRAFT_934762 [Trametes meyenii]